LNVVEFEFELRHIPNRHLLNDCTQLENLHKYSIVKCFRSFNTTCSGPVGAMWCVWFWYIVTHHLDYANLTTPTQIGPCELDTDIVFST